jgi:hypothetical protein
MSEFFDRYYPTICIRRAEMKALEMLPASEKQQMMPIVLLAPWLNSINFDNTFKIIDKSLGPIPMIVDLDRYFQSESDLPSRLLFRTLLSRDGYFDAWRTILDEHENFIPTIQFYDKSAEQIDVQIALGRELRRGFAFRLERDFPVNVELFFEKIRACVDDDIIVIFDQAYISDPQLEAANIASFIRQLIEISPEIPFVVSSSNFPNNFSDFDDFSQAQPIAARQLFETLRGQFDNYKMFYSDWASTKPRKYDGGGNRPLPRIDYPTRATWIISRSKENQWDFQQAAERITRLPEWEMRPQIWGTGMIEKTAQGIPNGISTGPQSIASRVNIHLYVQNNFGAADQVPPPSADWVDPI